MSRKTKRTVVMKFGGTSVKDAERVKRAAERIVETARGGNKVVVVVSAPGDMTDELIERAAQITDEPDGREMDMLLATGEQVSIALLCMAIKNLNKEAETAVKAFAEATAGADVREGLAAKARL